MGEERLLFIFEILGLVCFVYLVGLYSGIYQGVEQAKAKCNYQEINK